ncbi:MAG: cysteine desulfurase NifS [Solirubrobacterales bacterium]
MKNVYLDHSATTRIKNRIFDEMLPYLTNYFENPSSIYYGGKKVKGAIEDCRNKIANLLNCNRKEIYFTSCATESNNWAIKGIAQANKHKGNHIVTSKIEHPSILESCHYLEKNGFTVTYLPVNEYGLISLEALENSITDKTTLVSIMFANNEVGTIQPIKEIGDICKNKNVYFHTDAVQAIGNINIKLNEYNIDMLSLSGHKIYGPKGIGLLFIKNGVNIDPLIHGGSQENSRRAGTENAANCIGLAYALEEVYNNMERNINRLVTLRNNLIDGIQLNIPCSKLNGHPIKRLPNNANFSFSGVNGKTLVTLLDKLNIQISSGSACSCGSLNASHVLLALGLPDKLASESIRLTLGENTTNEDIDYIIGNLTSIIENLRTKNSNY